MSPEEQSSRLLGTRISSIFASYDLQHDKGLPLQAWASPNSVTSSPLLAALEHRSPHQVGGGRTDQIGSVTSTPHQKDLNRSETSPKLNSSSILPAKCASRMFDPHPPQTPTRLARKPPPVAEPDLTPTKSPAQLPTVKIQAHSNAFADIKDILGNELDEIMVTGVD